MSAQPVNKFQLARLRLLATDCGKMLLVVFMDVTLKSAQACQLFLNQDIPNVGRLKYAQAPPAQTKEQAVKQILIAEKMITRARHFAKMAVFIKITKHTLATAQNPVLHIVRTTRLLN